MKPSISATFRLAPPRHRVRLRAPAPASWLRLPRRTARLRLTLLYTGLIVLCITGALVITFLVASAQSPLRIAGSSGGGPGVVNTLTFARCMRSHGVSGFPDPTAPGARKFDLDSIPGVNPSSSSLKPAYTACKHLLPAPGSAKPPLPSSAARKVQKSGIAAGELAKRQHSADSLNLLQASAIALGIMIGLSTLLGWLAAGRVLAPLRTITTTAQTISAGNLGERLALQGPDDEFKALGDTLDGLLARLQASFEAQRRFVANASHELRTPLTVDRTLLELALTDPNASAATLRSTCEELLASSKEQERLLEALLTLASIERGLDHREPVDLGALTKQVLQTPPADAERLGLRIDTELAPAPASGDPALLQRLVANLIDNAAVYNLAGGLIELKTRVEHGLALLTVTNTGPRVPPDQLDRLLEPFQRLDQERAADTNGHHGLGLSIVRAIAYAHDATLTARARPEGGLAVTVALPRHGADPGGTASQ
jgi:signal transduction histidine kinase